MNMRSQTQRSRYVAYKRILSLTCRDFPVAMQVFKRLHWITCVTTGTQSQSLRSRYEAYKTTCNGHFEGTTVLTQWHEVSHSLRYYKRKTFQIVIIVEEQRRRSLTKIVTTSSDVQSPVAA
jgi:hypothetical protein